METKTLNTNWVDMRRQISDLWDEITEHDLDLINGDQEQLSTVLQKRYGYSRELACSEVEWFMSDYTSENTNTGRAFDMTSEYS